MATIYKWSRVYGCRIYPAREQVLEDWYHSRKNGKWEYWPLKDQINFHKWSKKKPLTRKSKDARKELSITDVWRKGIR